jgi:hypothetical protein
MKGGQLIEKNANSFILGPILWIILDILGGLAISLELSNFLQKKIKKGVSFMKEIANSCI